MEYIEALSNGHALSNPTLFEIISEQQLAGLIPDALRYCLLIATHRYPRYLLRVFNRFDEIYALLSLVIERLSLHQYSASLTEHFYGLKREKAVRLHTKNNALCVRLTCPDLINDALQLEPIDRWKSLLTLILWPYVKRKLDEAYEVHVNESSVLINDATRTFNQSMFSRLKHRIILFYYQMFLRKVYPVFNALYYATVLAFQVAYMFGHTIYAHPLYWLTRIHVRRISPSESRAIEQTSLLKPSTQTLQPGTRTWMPFYNPITIIRAMANILSMSLRFLLPTSLLALRILEWWHATNFAQRLFLRAWRDSKLSPPRLFETSLLSKAYPTQYQLNDNDNLSPSAPKQLHSDPPCAPISSTTLLPVLTVDHPKDDTSGLCPICGHEIVNATVAPTGYVYCFTCIFTWVEGTHARQIAFMNNEQNKGWDAEDCVRTEHWECGKGRCAVTGMKLLGGTNSLRRVIV